MEGNGLVKSWFVIYTKSRREKQVAQQLAKAGVEVFCPTLRTRRQWSDRTKEIEEPLFKSYCFVKLGERERQKVFSVEGVVRYLFWLQKPAIVREEEIQVIREFLACHDHESIQVRAVEVRDSVRITSGVFSEQEGTVCALSGGHVSVYLEALQMVLTVDIGKVSLERIHHLE